MRFLESGGVDGGYVNTKVGLLVVNYNYCFLRRIVKLNKRNNQIVGLIFISDKRCCMVSV